MPTEHPPLIVYGAEWCGVTQSTRRHLESKGVEYRYVDTDADPQASQWVKDHNHGIELKPTLDIGGRVLSAPKPEALDAVLREQGYLES